MWWYVLKKLIMKFSMPFSQNSRKKKRLTLLERLKNSRTPISTFIQSWPTNLASLAFGIAVLTTSCKESKKLSLEKHLQPNASGIVAVDSFQIAVETVKIDTPSTKNGPNLVMGHY